MNASGENFRQQQANGRKCPCNAAVWPEMACEIESGGLAVAKKILYLYECRVPLAKMVSGWQQYRARFDCFARMTARCF